jgi:hypothetical protein
LFLGRVENSFFVLFCFCSKEEVFYSLPGISSISH